MFDNFEELDECQVCIRAGVSLAIPVKKYYAEEHNIKKGMPVRVFFDKSSGVMFFMIEPEKKKQSIGDIFSVTNDNSKKVPVTSPAPEKTWPTGIADIDNKCLKMLKDEQKKLLVGWDGKDEHLPAGFMWVDFDLVYSDPTVKYDDITDEEKAEIEAQEQEEEKTETLPPMPETRCLGTEVHGKYYHEKYANRTEVYNSESGEWVTRYLDGTSRAHTESLTEKVKAYAQAAKSKLEAGK
jgi:hypothetical protein